jgi:hypothetical protein
LGGFFPSDKRYFIRGGCGCQAAVRSREGGRMRPPGPFTSAAPEGHGPPTSCPTDHRPLRGNLAIPRRRAGSLFIPHGCPSHRRVRDPCIPTLGAKPPSGTDWVHEIKHDGYRLIVRRDGPTAALFTPCGLRLELTLIVFAISKTYSERTAEQARRPLVLIANERQSQWAQARQPSGEVITHITLRFQPPISRTARSCFRQFVSSDPGSESCGSEKRYCPFGAPQGQNMVSSSRSCRIR